MTTHIKPLLLMLALAITSSAQTSKAPGVTTTRGSGGSIQTPLGYNIILNQGSSLEREWLTVHDPASPLALPGTIGIKTTYVSERSVGTYEYAAIFAAEASEPIVAFEIRFLLFDVWGNHLTTLSMTEIVDFVGPKEMSGTWKVYSENEVSKYYASIAFVARARTKGGRVFEANLAPVLEEARKLSRKFSPENLEPKPQKP